MKRYLLAFILGIGLLGRSEADASSPGNVVFASPNAPTTTATIDSTGTFVLQQTVTDGVLTQVKTTTITVVSSIVMPGVCLGSGAGIGGNAVNLQVAFSTGTAGIAGLQFDLTLPATVVSNGVTAGPILTAAGKSISSNMVGNALRVIVFGLNQTILTPGNLATISVQLAANLATGPIPMVLSNVTGTDAGGLAVAMASCNGAITVTANKAPVLTIGANQTITTPTLPVTVNLTSSATDDGSPNPPGALTYTWSKI